MPIKERIRTKNRVRAFAQKVFNGCKTCKIRHKKCDESKPHCQNCVKTGRTCDGYPPTSITSLPISRSPTPDAQLMSGNDSERRAFDFFHKHTIKYLAGLFNPSFWTRLVMQATFHEPAIRHAVCALGALHEYSQLHARGDAMGNVFAMQQYGKAMKSLVGGNGGRRVDLALMSCVLFVCFETMRGHNHTAISHIEGGVKIISEIQLSNKPTNTWAVSSIPYVPPSILNHIFVRLDRQASEIVYGRKRYLLYEELDDRESGYHEDIPVVFTSLEQARNSLDHMRTFAMRFIQTAVSEPSWEDPEKRAHSLHVLKTISSIRLQQWSAAFNALIDNIVPIDITAQEAIHVLKMHRIATGVVMTVDEERSFADETVWDQYYAQFARLISHGVSITNLHPKAKEEDQKWSSLGLDSGIGFQLYLVASKCRDGALRWRAIELLKLVDRQEGLYNTHLVGAVAQRIVEYEEQGLSREGKFLRADEVPGEQRLGGSEIRLMPDGRKVHLTYSKMGRREVGGDGHDGEKVVLEEWIDW